ncbi:MEDS domain-containing protein [Catellatospora sp. NPDC049609]|uniref:MEDS domain-containing protein n=1 Tax=Catellatospora sp. NPDC049609 TaxID=3155505 RepID=UPI0034392FD8
MAEQEAIDRLELGDHVCWSFDDDQRFLRSMSRYVMAGLRARHRILYYGHAWPAEALLAAFESHGVPTGDAVASGQLVVRSSTETYLRTGEFDVASTIDAWPLEAQRARDAGWTGLRVVGDMAWAAGPGAARIPGSERLVEYEGQVNQVFAHAEAMAVCLYDRRLYTSAELATVGSAHPGTLLDRGADEWSPLLRMRYTDDPLGVRLAGESDLSNRDALRTLLAGLDRRLPADKGRRLVIDVSALTFVDAAGALALADAVRGGSREAVLTGCSPALRRLLDMVAPGIPHSAVAN